MATHDLSDTESSEDEDLWCDVCRKSFSGPIPFLQHEKGAGHRKALMRGEPQPSEECRICRKEVPADSLERHKKGKPHKRAEAASKLRKQLKNLNISREVQSSDIKQKEIAEGNSSVEIDEFDEEELSKKVFECTECVKAFTGVEPYYNHLLSPAHEKVVNNQNQFRELSEAHPQFLKLQDDTLVCDICKVAFSGPEPAEAHLKSRGHRKKTELQQWRRKRRTQSKEEKPRDKATEDVSANVVVGMEEKPRDKATKDENANVESRDTYVENSENSESQKDETF